MENKIYNVQISFMLEIEAENAIEAHDSALDKLRWKMYENEARYLQIRIAGAKKIIPPATLPAPEEIAEKLANAAGVGFPEAELIPDPRLKDDIPF